MTRRAGPAVSRTIALALLGLRDLAGWPDVDALAERAADALRGGEGLSRWDLERLRRWPDRWSQIRPEIRTFYRTAIASEPTGYDRVAVGLGLRAVLDGNPAPGWVRGRLRQLYRDLLAEDVALELCPYRVGIRGPVQFHVSSLSERGSE